METLARVKAESLSVLCNVYSTDCIQKMDVATVTSPHGWLGVTVKPRAEYFVVWKPYLPNRIAGTQQTIIQKMNIIFYGRRLENKD